MNSLLLTGLTLLLGLNLFSQDSVILEVRTPNNLHQAIWHSPDTSVIFTSYNFKTDHTDTLGRIHAFPYNWYHCIGNDTSVTFAQYGWHVTCYRYELRGLKWNFRTFSLPPTFPVVGALFAGHIYTRYKYTFFDDGHIEAVKEIVEAENFGGPLKVLENKKVRFDLDRISKVFGSLEEQIIE